MEYVICNILKLSSEITSEPRIERLDFDDRIKYLAEENHNNWMKYKIDDGWTYGEEKDVELKTSPCLVDYNDLPKDQRFKNEIFVSTVL